MKASDDSSTRMRLLVPSKYLVTQRIIVAV